MVKFYYILLLLNLFLLPESTTVLEEGSENITEDTYTEKAPSSFQDYLRQSATKEGVQGKEQKREETDFTKVEPVDLLAKQQQGDAETAKFMEEFKNQYTSAKSNSNSKSNYFDKDLPDKLIALGIILTGFFCFVLFLSIRDSFKKPKK